MTRMVFLMAVKPDQIEAYQEAHRAVWPEVIEACRSVGMKNYSIFMADTHLIGYFEAKDCQESLKLLQKEEALQRWWTFMEPIMALEPDYSHGFKEVFHMV